MFEISICSLACCPEAPVAWCYVSPDRGFESDWGAKKNFENGSMEPQNKSV